MGVLNVGRRPATPVAEEDEISLQIQMARKRRAGFAAGNASAAGTSPPVGRDPNLCVTRGFHGPFGTDPGMTGEVDVGTCSVCGLTIFVPDHQPAYEIARFHGLTP